MMKQLAAIAILVGIALLVAVGCGGGSGSSETASQSDEPSETTVAAGPGGSSGSTAKGESFPRDDQRTVGGITRQEGDTIDFTVYVHDGNLYVYKSPEVAYAPNEMEFKVGQTVNFTLIGDEGSTRQHTFTVAALGIKQKVNFGATVKFTHTFNKAGTFRIQDLVFASNTGTITVVE